MSTQTRPTGRRAPSAAATGRRLLALTCVAATLTGAPAGGEEPAGAAAASRGGQAPGPAGWVAEQYAALAATSPAAARAVASAPPAGGPATPTMPFGAGDLDGDGVGDVLGVRYVGSPFAAGSRVELTLYSGRTGAYRWRRAVADGGVPFTGYRVGRDGRPGIVLFRPYQPAGGDAPSDPLAQVEELLGGKPRATAFRFVGIAGRTGRVVYDRRVESTDGKGEVQLGGFFDGFRGGGTDILVGRIRRVAAPFAAVPPITLPTKDHALYDVAPYLVDGSDGAVHQVHPTLRELTSGIRYGVAGDLDGDRRDDVVRTRGDLGSRLTVTAYSTIEERTLWETGDIPSGGSADLWSTPRIRSGDVTGSDTDDVVLNVAAVPSDSLYDTVARAVPALAPPEGGAHGVLLDGRTGEVVWHRRDADRAHGSYGVFDDVDRDGKREVLFIGAADKPGLRFRVIDRRSRVLIQRDVVKGGSAADVITSSSTAAGSDFEIDGDRIGDVRFRFHGTTAAGRPVELAGWVLLKANRYVETTDQPLHGTLDGGAGGERISLRTASGRSTFVLSDGWRGGAYWRITAPGGGWQVGPIHGLRGRCADLMITGATSTATWVEVVHGGTGRVRWSRTLAGQRPRHAVATLTRVRPVRCR